jgi:serine phosphatase RsbU (regulator of sigma subunit)
MTHRLTPKARADLSRLLAVQTKTLGELLQEAGLISPWQIESALQVKMKHPELRIGEIMAQQNSLEPKTADFFAQDLTKAVVAAKKNTLGYYLQQAAILDREQIEIILAEQRASGIRFGTVAVFQGFIKSTTLDFFLTNLFPEESKVSPFINMHKGYSLLATT